jgi:hypothetical protein
MVPCMGVNQVQLSPAARLPALWTTANITPTETVVEELAE